jgi:hypothetical protein
LVGVAVGGIAVAVGGIAVAVGATVGVEVADVQPAMPVASTPSIRRLINTYVVALSGFFIELTPSFGTDFLVFEHIRRLASYLHDIDLTALKHTASVWTYKPA